MDEASLHKLHLAQGTRKKLLADVAAHDADWRQSAFLCVQRVGLFAKMGSNVHCARYFLLNRTSFFDKEKQ